MSPGLDLDLPPSLTAWPGPRLEETDHGQSALQGDSAAKERGDGNHPK